MKIDRQTVDRVAALARLELTPDEVELFRRDLNAIVDYVAQLSEADTDSVEPLAHAMDLTDVLRADVAAASLTRDAALSNAPDGVAGGFRVPRVVE